MAFSVTKLGMCQANKGKVGTVSESQKSPVSAVWVSGWTYSSTGQNRKSKHESLHL